ncbi:MAG TPA: hypothetical protein ENN66_08925 [Proteobacteria bacterium]|nr:hypothetical protein [Pseudomonadota bacterium]
MKMKRILLATIILAASLIVCSGITLAGDFATTDECISMCKKAVAMYNEKGEEATFQAINDQSGPFVWKDSYVFAMNAENGIILAHPMKPGLIGKDLLALKDINGTMIFVELLKAAKAGEGWAHYMWPKPGEKQASKKASYIYTIPGTTIAMGAGAYE